MIKEFIYLDGNVIPYDNKDGLCNAINYQDNIGEIFVMENIIEHLNLSLKNIKNKKDKLQSDLSESSNLKVVLPLLICMFIALVSNVLLGRFAIEIENSIFNGMNIYALVSYPLYTVIGTLFSIDKYVALRKMKKIYNAFCVEEEFIQYSIDKYNKNLKELKEDKKAKEKDIFEDNQIVKINYYKHIRVIVEALKKCSDFGYKKECTQEYKNEKIKEVEDFVDNNFKSLKKEKNMILY